MSTRRQNSRTAGDSVLGRKCPEGGTSDGPLLHAGKRGGMNRAFDPDGRKCTGCRTWHEWRAFDLKPGGINGRDSRCKRYIKIAKAAAYRRKGKLREKARAQDAAFQCCLIGSLDEDAAAGFAVTFAAGLQGLLDVDKI